MKKTTKQAVKAKKVKAVKKVKRTPEEVAAEKNMNLVMESCTRQRAKSLLVEQVISIREVKYKYPSDCINTLDRKAFRQRVRACLRKLELELLKMGKKSKDYEKTLKHFEAEKRKYLKAA
jgi:hypothetical protein